MYVHVALCTNMQQVRVRDTKREGVWVQGLSQETIATKQDVADLVRLGFGMRAVGMTLMNERSSRSHCIFILNLHQNYPDGSSKVRFVCLWGSMNNLPTYQPCSLPTSLPVRVHTHVGWHADTRARTHTDASAKFASETKHCARACAEYQRRLLLGLTASCWWWLRLSCGWAVVRLGGRAGGRAPVRSLAALLLSVGCCDMGLSLIHI